VYPYFDFQSVLGYLNYFSLEWRVSFPKFDGDPSLAVTHVVEYMKYSSRLNVLHEYVLIIFFVYSLE
jgi:hypothetical protein